jgi:hypothetical protein
MCGRKGFIKRLWYAISTSIVLISGKKCMLLIFSSIMLGGRKIKD